jgi:hypothetical protein
MAHDDVDRRNRARLWDAADDPDFPPVAPTSGVKLADWRPMTGDSGNLIGYAAITLPAPLDGVVITNIPIFRDAETGAWLVGQPAQAQIDAAGRVRLRGGRRQYNPIVSFATRAARENWRVIVLTALFEAGVGPGP